MARTARRGRSEAKSVSRSRGKKSGGRSPLRFLVSPIFWRLLVVLAAGYGIYRLYPKVASWSVTASNAVLDMFGYGLIIFAAVLGALAFLIVRGFSPFFRRWNRWLGALFFLAAAWGILAFFYAQSGILAAHSLGGRIGQRMIGAPDFAGVLRVAALVLLGFLLVTPRHTVRYLWLAARGLGLGLWKAASFLRSRLRRPARPEPLPQQAGEPEAGAPLLAAVTQAPQPARAATAETRLPAEAQTNPAGEVEKLWLKLSSKSILTPSGWELPPMDILEKGPGEKVAAHQVDNSKRARAIEEALASYGVEAKVVETNVGPAVTQFGVEPGWDRKYKEIKGRDEEGNVTVRQEEVSRTRVKVDRIASLANDLALALSAPTIRIEAPVPGKPIVGIEVPNSTTGVVTLRSVVETGVFQKLRARSRLALALGKGAGGEAAAEDLAKMPHLLIAGATGSGKTVCLHTIIASILMHNTPEDVQLLMVDPKRVELVSYNTIPHLVAPVVVEPEKSVDVLRWLLSEMDRRYTLFAQASARSIDDYNRKRAAESLPHLVLVVDELADLMMTASDEVERLLCRLAQLARATGIHLVVATQRPSVDVVTGLIKANFPTRISFAVTSQVDSRTILDAVGAEKLLGKGDMLFMPTDAAKPRRLQGCYVSDQEIERLVFFWNGQKGPMAPIKVEDFAAAVPGGPDGRSNDPLLASARRLAQEHRHISASFLQRKLHIGYARAAQLMDMVEKERQKEGAEPEPEDEEEDPFVKS